MGPYRIRGDWRLQTQRLEGNCDWSCDPKWLDKMTHSEIKTIYTFSLVHGDPKWLNPNLHGLFWDILSGGGAWAPPPLTKTDIAPKRLKLHRWNFLRFFLGQFRSKWDTSEQNRKYGGHDIAILQITVRLQFLRPSKKVKIWSPFYTKVYLTKKLYFCIKLAQKPRF